MKEEAISFLIYFCSNMNESSKRLQLLLSDLSEQVPPHPFTWGWREISYQILYSSLNTRWWTKSSNPACNTKCNILSLQHFRSNQLILFYFLHNLRFWIPMWRYYEHFLPNIIKQNWLFHLQDKYTYIISISALLHSV